MKRLVVLICVLATFSLSAQQGPRHKQGKAGMGMMKDLSPDEAATLKTKKMTLDLDLSEAQQDKIYKIQLKNAQERQTRMEEIKKLREEGEMKKPSKEERYTRMNEGLDKQIAHKKEMKAILDQDQFEKWERGRKRHSQKRKGMKNQRSKRSRR
ncbi:MAG: hypothetical protein KJO49_06790 [Bacteroidia bacterium]|nr:hypothetical protein [Bacteroidia bacterium]